LQSLLLYRPSTIDHPLGLLALFSHNITNSHSLHFVEAKASSHIPPALPTYSDESHHNTFISTESPAVYEKRDRSGRGGGLSQKLASVLTSMSCHN
jgi:hypothetical protein